MQREDITAITRKITKLMRYEPVESNMNPMNGEAAAPPMVVIMVKIESTLPKAACPKISDIIPFMATVYVAPTNPCIVQNTRGVSP